MGLVVKKLEILGDKGITTKEVLFDSAARRSAIRKDVAQMISTIISLPKAKAFGLADSRIEMHSDSVAVISVRVDGKEIDGSFYVLENLCREVIVGSDMMQTWSIIIDPRKETVHVGADPDEIEFF